MKNTFVTTQHKAIELYPEIAAAPVKTSNEFKVNSLHHIKLALIPKQNIGVDPTYQRQLNIKQVTKITEKWDYDLERHHRWSGSTIVDITTSMNVLVYWDYPRFANSTDIIIDGCQVKKILWNG